jgi:uncharacterized protein (TIGR03790 family)
MNAPNASNLLVVYRDGDADSLAFAEHYRDARGVPPDRLLGVPCSDAETLADYATFQAQVETPLADWLATNDPDREITIILLGYGVPGGFRDAGMIYSAASRLVRLGNARSPATMNPLYDELADGLSADARLDRAALDAAGIGYLVHRIDADTPAHANAIVDAAVALDGATLAGRGWLDPYGLQGGGYESYEDLLESWGRSLAAQRRMRPIERSADSDPAENVVFAELTDDDFYFGWHRGLTPMTFFGPRGAGSRAIACEADSYAMETLRTAVLPPLLSIDNEDGALAEFDSTTISGDSTLVQSADAARDGGLGLGIETIDGGNAYATTPAFADEGDLWIGFWLRINAVEADGYNICRFIRNAGGDLVELGLWTTESGEGRLRAGDSAGAVIGTAAWPIGLHMGWRNPATILSSSGNATSSELRAPHMQHTDTTSKPSLNR